MYILKIKRQTTIEDLGSELESLLRNLPLKGGGNHPLEFRESCWPLNAYSVFAWLPTRHLQFEKELKGLEV